MFRAYLFAGLLALSWFSYAQYKGYSVFASHGSSGSAFVGGGGSRIYHK